MERRGTIRLLAVDKGPGLFQDGRGAGILADNLLFEVGDRGLVGEVKLS
jgi:hypothetical protein